MSNPNQTIPEAFPELVKPFPLKRVLGATASILGMATAANVGYDVFSDSSAEAVSCPPNYHWEPGQGSCRPDSTSTTKPRTSTTKPRTTTTQPRTTTKPTTGTTTRSTSGSTKTSSTSGGYGAGPSTTELVIDMDKDGYAAAEDADDNSPSTGFAGVTVAQETGINVDSATEEGKLNAWLLGTVEATNPAELDKLRRDYGAFGVKVLVEGEACAEGTVAQEVIPVATAGTEVASTTTTTLDTLPPQGSLAVEGFIAQGKVLDLPADPKDLVFHYFKCVVDNTVSQTTTPDTTFYAN